MNRHLLYVIGQPGSGKSTLVKELTSGLMCAVEMQPFAHTIWRASRPVVELGCRRDAFSGTDALGMSVQPVALTYMRDTPEKLILGEGDRLGNDSFLAAALELGWDVQVIRLTVSAAIAENRRAIRAAALGTTLQNETWLKGRITKVRNVAALWEARGRLHDVDGDQPPAYVLDEVKALGNPVVEALGALVASRL